MNATFDYNESYKICLKINLQRARARKQAFYPILEAIKDKCRKQPICYMLIGLLLLALFFPIYRAERFLGFVLGMTFTFGGVLPIGVASVLALLGAGLYLVVRFGSRFASSRFTKDNNRQGQ